MKICYFIQTHKNLGQVYRLVRTIKKASPAAQVLIGHDFTSCYLDINPLLDLSEVHLIKGNTPALWGDFSLLQPYLNAINWLFEHNSDFEWLIYISGQDYPTQPLSQIEYFLSETEYDGFMEYFDVFSDKCRWGIDESVKRYLRLYFRPLELAKPLLKKISKIQNFTPIRYYFFHDFLISIPAIKTPFKDNFMCYGGSQWHTLSRKCVQYIKDFIKNNPRLIGYYKKTLVPDESVIQTILMNSNKFNICNSNKRYIVFLETDEGHAKILTKEDYTKISHGDFHFARKFEQDSDMLNMFDTIIFPVIN